MNQNWMMIPADYCLVPPADASNVEHVFLTKCHTLEENFKELLENISGVADGVLEKAGFGDCTSSRNLPADNVFQRLTSYSNSVLLHLANVSSDLRAGYERRLEKLNEGRPSINKEADAPPLPDDCLSVGDQRTLAAVSQFVIALGFHPYFLPGVGVDLKARVKSGSSIVEDIRQCSSFSKLTLQQVCIDPLLIALYWSFSVHVLVANLKFINLPRLFFLSPFSYALNND
jgi:hypothetical protein